MTQVAELSNIKPANLWSKMKQQCLNSNPYIREDDDGKTILKCPRCGSEDLEMNYTVLSIQPDAMEWSSPVTKCPNCSHLWSFVR